MAYEDKMRKMRMQLASLNESNVSGIGDGERGGGCTGETDSREGGSE